MSPVELTDVTGGEGGGRGAKPYDSEKAWSSLNHLILFAREEERAMRKTIRNLSISGSVCVHCTIMEDKGQGGGVGVGA